MNAKTQPPSDRYCDLVMKGGITSGVVYPMAIAELARHYRFRSIGGTSAGAIAAAVTAAAEYQRRQTGSNAGFELLSELPKQLQATVAPVTSRLLSLFQPQRATRRLFAVLAAALNSRGTNERIAKVVFGFVMAYWPAALLAIALTLLARNQGGLAIVLTFLVAEVVFVAVWVYRDITTGLVGNGFGLCTGMTEDRAHPALTPWLHELIQRAAGRTVDDDPLTFGDLWSAEGFPPPWLEVSDPGKARSIDLQMFTTNLAHGRPYIFPLADFDDTKSRFRFRDQLFFRPELLEKYFPPRVHEWMVKHSRPYAVEPGREESDPSEVKAAALRELPPPAEVPVLVAARMSLSFPLLFSALPLYAINYNLPENRDFICCWFSDGGISSNFPMHLFDGLVPMWPTFGITLEAKIEGRPMTYLPQRYEEGYGERIVWLCDEKQKPATRLGGFLSAIVGAMQNWSDNTNARMPGVRDRVVRVRLERDEGGMNLNMRQVQIDAVAKRGLQAGNELIARFAEPAADGGQAAGWDEHRFTRLCTLLEVVNHRIPGISTALDPAARHVSELKALLQKIQRAPDPAGNPMPPPGFEQPMTDDQRLALEGAVQALGRFATAFRPEMTTVRFKPVPNPELRVRSPL